MLLGIDGGGTKTEAMLTDDAGGTLALKTGGGGNVNDDGMAAVTERLRNILRELLSPYGGLRAPLTGVYAGMSGAASSGNAERLASFLTDLLPGALRVTVRSDAFNGLYALTGGDKGISVIAGTGSAAFVRTGDGMARVGGWGSLIDDAGGGFAIGRACLNAALRMRDGRGSDTALAVLVARKLGGEPADMLPQIYAGGKRLIASLAPCAMEAADAGDPVAQDIVSQAAEEIILLIRAAARYVADAPPYAVALSGGLWKSSLFVQSVLARLDDDYAARVVDCAPVCGCVAAAAESAGLDACAVALRAPKRDSKVIFFDTQPAQIECCTTGRLAD